MEMLFPMWTCMGGSFPPTKKIDQVKNTRTLTNGYRHISLDPHLSFSLDPHSFFFDSNMDSSTSPQTLFTLSLPSSSSVSLHPHCLSSHSVSLNSSELNIEGSNSVCLSIAPDWRTRMVLAHTNICSFSN